MRYIFIFLKKHIISLICLLTAAAVIICASLFPSNEPLLSFLADNQEIESILNDYFNERSTSLITGDLSYIDGQFDKSSRYGKWSYEHEVKRINYLKEWSAARRVKLKDCEVKLKLFSIRQWQNTVKIYLSARTRITYAYEAQKPEALNEFCLGTKHTINLVNKNGDWYVTVDWYNDPLEDSMPESAPSSAIEGAEENYETSAAGWVKYNRAKAVEYADKYCGANFNIQDGYKYNKKYRNYAELGGDCANFASQVLSDKDAGGIKMSSDWLYKRGEASASWVNAGAFTKNMLYSGRAKQVSRGKYSKVVNFTKYISPGDIVSYERKGDIVHVSIVTAVDSMGVPLVNSHTNDRYHVPWDLGWNGDNITFWFLKING